MAPIEIDVFGFVSDDEITELPESQLNIEFIKRIKDFLEIHHVPSSGLDLTSEELIFNAIHFLLKIENELYVMFRRHFSGPESVMLIKSCNDIEEKYINYMSILTNKRVVPVGVLSYHEECEETEHDKEMMEWLDSKEKASTVYVSFGSETYLSEKEIEELAFGLEISNVNFIWVIRFPGEAEKIKIEEVLPEGFVDRVKGRGIIVEGWAPQDKILRHSSTVSHCGWGSVTESLSHGVPIIGLPMNFDQPLNCRMVAELGAGLEIEKNGKLEFQRTEVARVIKEVMNGDSTVRKMAKDLSENIKMNEAEVISVAVEEIIKVCVKIQH